ncbi:hypothetical protein QBC34DRAFT_458189 [Podospora aff. communis PSN243]|uniref:Lytic polysaccharide monooxygenase n=1 Tax=Podospora aff. communis PSN243 TaxID=3040156 RepID=A0AAV9GTQ6_9PEZI|nr:hypothetical protein QBC34DRAFT_458189 [Podospora aff. communis PSN243]
MATSSALFALLGAAQLLFRSASGHMIMSSPIPYNLNTQPFVQVNPLNGDLNPFPCQNRTGVEFRTSLEAGTAALVKFTGGAQHGGGSCQFSISYDDPSAGWSSSAKFKTVYSIIGGCPAQFTDESRNLPPAEPDQQGRANTAHCGNDFDVNCSRQFLVPLPKFLKNGPATFAWTWFNKVGNREMYMTCAPVTITGGTADEHEIQNLPDIFVANVPNTPASDCVTGTSSDHVVLNYPNPGKYGRVIESPNDPQLKPSNYCSAIPPASVLPNFEPDSRTIQGTGTVLNPTIGTASAHQSTPTAASTTKTTIPASQPSSSTHESLSESTLKSRTDTVTTTHTETNTATPTGPAAPDPKGVVSCPEDGAVVCLEGGYFGLCNWGEAIPQKVAPGTECVDGKIVIKVMERRGRRMLL